MEKYISIISNIPLFSGFSENYLKEIENIAVEKKFSRGEIIFSEGDNGNGFYVVVDGQVKIHKASFDGKEKILHIFGPGEPFGEVPVFTGRAFPANAEALSKSRLIFFPKDAFVGLIMKNPSLALSMLGVLSMRLREFTIQIEHLALKEVPGRIASYLLYVSGEQESSNRVELEISKGQLASLLGTIPETLSRIFSKMSSQGLIEVEGRTIWILDRQGLKDMAESGKYRIE
jgi:CRP/FNR family transcriptional regulator, dissimilatory nitrate respiration regulator